MLRSRIMPQSIPRWFRCCGVLLVAAALCFSAAALMYSLTMPPREVMDWRGIFLRLGAGTGMAGLFCLVSGFVAWERYCTVARRRLRDQRCIGCDYDLRGSPLGDCPECGQSRAVLTSPSTTAPATTASNRWAWWVLVFIAGLFLGRRVLIIWLVGDPRGMC